MNVCTNTFPNILRILVILGIIVFGGAHLRLIEHQVGRLAGQILGMP